MRTSNTFYRPVLCEQPVYLMPARLSFRWAVDLVWSYDYVLHVLSIHRHPVETMDRWRIFDKTGLTHAQPCVNLSSHGPGVEPKPVKCSGNLDPGALTTAALTISEESRRLVDMLGCSSHSNGSMNQEYAKEIVVVCNSRSGHLYTTTHLFSRPAGAGGSGQHPAGVELSVPSRKRRIVK